MASSTGIPAQAPAQDRPAPTTSLESEPLLGQPGDAVQPGDASMWRNLVLGTGGIAQAGALLLLLLVWVNVFVKPLILFSGHPIAQTLAIFIPIESILLLQPTRTAAQKRTGQRLHFVLNLSAFLLLVAGTTIIEYNEFASKGPHFHSVHAYFGVITSFFILSQFAIGFTMWATPKLYGSEDTARSIYKYHRLSGYFTLILLLITAGFASSTDYNVKVLRIDWWALLIAIILVIIGVMPRIHMQKAAIFQRV